MITGVGVAEAEVRAEIRSNRVQMLSMVDDARLEHELSIATAGVVSQRSDLLEFNVPSKLMNYMMRGLSVSRSRVGRQRFHGSFEPLARVGSYRVGLAWKRRLDRSVMTGDVDEPVPRRRVLRAPGFPGARCTQDFERVILASLRE